MGGGHTRSWDSAARWPPAAWPVDDFLHAREELFAAGDHLFIRILGLGKTGLMGHASEFRNPRLAVCNKSKTDGLNHRFPRETLNKALVSRRGKF